MSDEDETAFTEEDIEEIAEKLRIARASRPVHCKKCGERIPRSNNYAPYLEDALKVTLGGGYGMWIDEPDWTFYLCKTCAYGVVQFLGMDIPIENWGDK